MNGYYIYEDVSSFPGVENKINLHINEFKKIGKIQILIINEKNDILSKIKKRLPFLKRNANYNEILKQLRNVEYIYIRKPLIEKGFVSFLCKLKKKEPECKIILEIPTYPYDTEFLKNFSEKWKIYPIYMKEIYNRKKLWKYVNRIVTYSNYDKIWNIKTIKTINGINVYDLPVIKENKKNLNNVINLLSVATMQKQHAYDRIIKGMKLYYQSFHDITIYYHVVGDGPELSYYKNLVKKFHLEKYIIFYGKLMGDKLDNVYNKADIGVEVLGLHRNKIKVSSSLKSREYFARGLPFITSSNIDIIDDMECKYVLKLEDNENDVDMNNIIKFYKQLYKNPDNLHKKIRDIAIKKCDISISMKPIFKYLQQ